MDKNKLIFAALVIVATIYIYNAGQSGTGALSTIANLGKSTGA